VFLWRLWFFGRQVDVVVVADVVQGIATQGFGIKRTAKIGQFLPAGAKIAVEGGVRYIGQSGQF